MVRYRYRTGTVSYSFVFKSPTFRIVSQRRECGTPREKEVRYGTVPVQVRYRKVRYGTVPYCTVPGSYYKRTAYLCVPRNVKYWLSIVPYERALY